MQKIIAGYIRVSTEMQVERDSLVNQGEIITEHVRSKNGALKIYRDAGISAKDRHRPAFQEMLNDIKKGMIESVVVTKLDRITRSLKDLIFLKEFFEEYGVTFISISQNLDTSTPMGRFCFYILGLVAELEREMTAERVAEDMKNRAKRGKWNGGPIPFGYLYKDKILLVNSDEAVIVKTIFRLYGEYRSFRKVVHSLNSLRIMTRQGHPWASTSIRRILQNPIYYGALTYNKRRSSGKGSKSRPKEEHIIVEEAVDPIVSREQFSEVQKIIADQKKIPSSSKRSQYLLTGLLECKSCGTKMYGYTYKDPRKDGRVYQYYRCNGHISKGSAFCPGNTVDAKFIEGSILGELKRISTNPEKLRDKIDDFRIAFDREMKPLLDGQKATLQSLAKNRRRAERLLNLYEDELIEKEVFVKEKEVLDVEKKLLEKDLEGLNQRIFSSDLANFDFHSTLSSIQNLGEVFEELDLDERKELLRTIVNKIEVGKQNMDCKIFALPKSFVDYSRTDRGSWLP